jgi:hypothetical protein
MFMDATSCNLLAGRCAEHDHDLLVDRFALRHGPRERPDRSMFSGLHAQELMRDQWIRWRITHLPVHGPQVVSHSSMLVQA